MTNIQHSEVICPFCKNDDARMIEFIYSNEEGLYYYVCEVCSKVFRLLKNARISLSDPLSESLFEKE